MSTQYEFVKTQVVEEIASFQNQLHTIQDECINRIKAVTVSPELADLKDDLIDKISNQYLFHVEEPESASIVIGTARAGHFSWRADNGFRDLIAVEQWLHNNPEFSIYDEYGAAVSLEQFKGVVAWCNG